MPAATRVRRKRQTAPPSQPQQPLAANRQQVLQTKQHPPAATRSSRRTVKPAARAALSPTPEIALPKQRRRAPNRSHLRHPSTARAAGQRHTHAHARRRPSRLPATSATFLPVSAAARHQPGCQAPHPKERNQPPVANACGEHHPHASRRPPADNANSRLPSKRTASATPLPAPAPASPQRLRPEPSRGRQGSTPTPSATPP